MLNGLAVFFLAAEQGVCRTFDRASASTFQIAGAGVETASPHPLNLLVPLRANASRGKKVQRKPTGTLVDTSKFDEDGS